MSHVFVLDNDRKPRERILAREVGPALCVLPQNGRAPAGGADLPQVQGGSDQVSHLALACEPCNAQKATMTAAEFGNPEVPAQAKLPLKDAATMTTIRWVLFERLKAIGLPGETGTGGQTKWNRITRQL